MFRHWIASTCVAAGLLVGVAPVGASGLAPTDPRATPTCQPAAAPSVASADRTRLIVSVPKCTTTSGVIGYRVQAVNLAGTSVVKTVDTSTTATSATITGLANGTAYRLRVAARGSDGVGPHSVLSAPVVPPFTTLGAFTDRQHRDFLGRAPSSSESSSWATRIGNGSLSPVAAVDEVHSSTYWQRQSPIIRLYQAYFLRLPDSGGLSYWVGLYRGGRSLNAISQSFSGTPEFRELYGTLTDRQFVARVYQNVLGRTGTTGEVDYWTAEITSGRRSRGAVMIGFSESPENKARLAGTVDVVNLFTGMLRRVPTSAEVTTWKTRTRAQIITHLLGTSAYSTRVAIGAPVSQVVGTWRGTYTCNQGLTGLQLTITSAGGDAVRATFAFSAVPSNPGVPDGSYSMEGTATAEGLELEATEWIVRPSGYFFVHLAGPLPGSSGQLRGDAIGSGCSTYQLTKVG